MKYFLTFRLCAKFEGFPDFPRASVGGYGETFNRVFRAMSER